MGSFFGYILPMLMCLIGLTCWIFLEKGPASDRMPRWIAILWFLFSLCPVINWIVGIVAIISVFWLTSVKDWLEAPVRQDEVDKKDKQQ